MADQCAHPREKWYTSVVGGTCCGTCFRVLYEPGEPLPASVPTPASQAFRVPERICVLGQAYTVEVMRPGEPLERGVAYHTVGSTHLERQRIRIRGLEEITPHQMADTLLHETLHAVFSIFRINPDGDDNNEVLVAALAPALLHTLRDNPELVAALLVDFGETTP